METTPPNPKPPSSPRERAQARIRSRTAGRTPPRPASPTRSIEPGIVHYRIAEGILRGLQTKVKEDTGMDLDVGEFPDVADTGSQSDDPELIPNLTAHMVARTADRFPLFRKVSRHFEGKERRAGLLSDLAAAVVAVYKRNPEIMEHLGQQLVTDLQQRKAAARASRNGGTKSPPQPTPRPAEGVTPQ